MANKNYVSKLLINNQVYYIKDEETYASVEAAKKEVQNSVNTAAAVATINPRKISTFTNSTNKNYVYYYIGTDNATGPNGETLQTNHWYYWNGSAWTQVTSEIPLLVPIDASLTVQGAAADAKAVGDALTTIDTSLTVQGSAADAKTVGDALTTIDNRLTILDDAAYKYNFPADYWTDTGYLTYEGAISTSGSYVGKRGYFNNDHLISPSNVIRYVYCDDSYEIRICIYDGSISKANFRGDWTGTQLYVPAGANDVVWGNKAFIPDIWNYINEYNANVEDEADLINNPKICISLRNGNNTFVPATATLHLTYQQGPDTSLTQSGIPADAKAVNEKIMTTNKFFEQIIEENKNLFDRRNISPGYFSAHSGHPEQDILKASTKSYYTWIPCEPGQAYTVSKHAGTRFSVGTTTVKPEIGIQINNVIQRNSATTITITPAANNNYLLVWFYYHNPNENIEENETLEERIASIQIEKRSSATTYVTPYSAIDHVARDTIDRDILIYRGAIANNTDLNTLYQNGWYSCAYDHTYVNGPENGAQTRKMVVIMTNVPYEPSLTSQKVMYYINFSSGTIYTRMLIGQVWYSWKPITNNTDYTLTDGAEYAVRYDLRGGQNNARQSKVFTLVHFSDVHGGTKTDTASINYQGKTGYKQLMNWCNRHRDLFDDMLCTGDIVDGLGKVTNSENDYHIEQLNFWKNEPNHEKILITVGNHDVKDEDSSTKDNWLRKSLATTREQFLYGLITEVDGQNSWGAISGSVDSFQNNTNYPNATWWYKDYNTYNIRLIGLDTTIPYFVGLQNPPIQSQADDAAQQAWFTSCLNDAKIKNMSVIVAQHYRAPHPTKIKCDFSSENFAYGDEREFFSINPAYLDIVHNFIQSGGHFICHLAGHTHNDLVVYDHTIVDGVEKYSDQVFFVVGSVWPDLRTTDLPREVGTKSGTLANIISFDTNRHLIRICRIGACYDTDLRPRKLLVYNYETKQVIRQTSGDSTS